MSEERFLANSFSLCIFNGDDCILVSEEAYRFPLAKVFDLKQQIKYEVPPFREELQVMHSSITSFVMVEFSIVGTEHEKDLRA